MTIAHLWALVVIGTKTGQVQHPLAVVSVQLLRPELQGLQTILWMPLRRALSRSTAASAGKSSSEETATLWPASICCTTQGTPLLPQRIKAARTSLGRVAVGGRNDSRGRT